MLMLTPMSGSIISQFELNIAFVSSMFVNLFHRH